MRIAVISSRYPPESSPCAKRASDLVEALRLAGHQVTVLTQFPNYPDPRSFGYDLSGGTRMLVEENGGGNCTWRFAPRIVPREALGGRLVSEAVFAFRTSRPRTRLAGLDGVFTSTPFVFNLLAARSYRLPMWLDLRDLTWEYARLLGPRSRLKRIGTNVLRSVALSSFRAARGISTTSLEQRRYLIDRGIPEEKIRLVPNGVPRAVMEDLSRRSAAPGSRVGPLKVVYAGLLGYIHGLGFAVEAIAEMSGVELHLYGEGVDRQRLAAHCQERGLRHVFFHGHIPYNDYLQVIANADVLLATLRPEADSSMPSKLPEYMAAGKPILFAGSGEGAQVLGEAGAGVILPYGDKALFQERLRELAQSPALRSELGTRGREWVSRHRVREEINKSLVEAIEDAFRSGGRGTKGGAPRSAAGSPRVGQEGSPAPAPGRVREGGAGILGRLDRLALAAARGAELSGLLRLLERTMGGSSRLPVLAYHRVVEPEACPCPSIRSATPAGFALQMDYLAANCRVVSMEEVLEALRSGRPLPARAVLLSFDDAYRDFLDHAWPILKQRGLPVTLFVPTAFPDHPELAFWWDRLFQAVDSTAVDEIDTPLGLLPLGSPEERRRAYRRLRDRVKDLPHAEAMDLVDRICRELGPGPAAPGVLSWDEIRSLAWDGLTLGAHTRTHPALDRLPLDAARAEILGSIEDLRRETGSELPIFSYPSGRHDEQAVRILADAGVELAFAMGNAINDLRHAGRLTLQRIKVGPRTTRPVLRAQFLGIRSPSRLRKWASRAAFMT